jgi:hypothetical protein
MLPAGCVLCSFLYLLIGIAPVNFYGLIRSPDGNSYLGGMVLDKAMIAHELHGPVAMTRFVLCRIPSPQAERRQMRDEDTVQPAEV